MSDTLAQLRAELPDWTWEEHADLPGAVLGHREGLRLCLDRLAPVGALPAVWWATVRETAAPHVTLAGVHGGLGDSAVSVAMRTAQAVKGGA